MSRCSELRTEDSRKLAVHRSDKITCYQVLCVRSSTDQGTSFVIEKAHARRIRRPRRSVCAVDVALWVPPDVDEMESMSVFMITQ
jgi:hypothetical protein